MEDQFKIELIFNSIKICKFLQNIFFSDFFVCLFLSEALYARGNSKWQLHLSEKNKSIFE